MKMRTQSSHYPVDSINRLCLNSAKKFMIIFFFLTATCRVTFIDSLSSGVDINYFEQVSLINKLTEQMPSNKFTSHNTEDKKKGHACVLQMEQL